MKLKPGAKRTQNEVIEKILRGHQSGADGHRRAALVGCASVPVGGLWQALAPRGPPDPFGLVHDLDSDLVDQTSELTYVDMDTFLATF